MVMGQRAFDVYEAAWFGADDGGGAGGQDVLDLVVRQGLGHAGEAHAERAAEPAAGVRRGGFDEGEAANMREQKPGLGGKAQGAAHLAGIVVHGGGGEVRAEVGGVQDVHEKLGEFVGASGQGAGLCGCSRVVGEKLRIAADHAGAGARGADHGVGLGKKIEDAAGQGPDFGGMAELEKGLAATGLAGGRDGIDSGGAKDLEAGDAGLGHGVLDQAGDEKHDAHGGWAPFAAAACGPEAGIPPAGGKIQAGAGAGLGAGCGGHGCLRSGISVT